MTVNRHDATLRGDLSEPMEDLLKALYQAELVGEPEREETLADFRRRQRRRGSWVGEARLEALWRDEAWKVGTGRLAERLGVTPSAISQLLGKLGRMGLVERERYRTPALTVRGRLVAKEMVRHHRLLELFLTESLGLSEEEAHPEAERLEHVISESLEDAIAARLGHPTHDPHGAPIPGADLEMPADSPIPLSDLAAGDRAKVQRIAGFDPLLHAHLAESGVVPGVELEVAEVEPWGGGWTLTVAGRDGAARLSAEAAAQVGVEIMEVPE